MKKFLMIVAGLLIGGLFGLYSFGFLAWGGEREDLQAQLKEANRNLDHASKALELAEVKAKPYVEMFNKANADIKEINSKLKALADKEAQEAKEKK